MPDEITQPVAPAPSATAPVVAPPSSPAPAPVAATPAPTPVSSAPGAAPAPAATPAAPAADPRADIDAFATSVGMSPTQFSHFQDVAAARAAVRLWADEAARDGLNHVRRIRGGQAPAPASTTPPAPVAPASAATGAVDLSALGLDESDPVAKVVRALSDRLAASDATVQELKSKYETYESNSKAAEKAAARSAAEEVVSTFQSPMYGVAGNRTSAQQWNLARLYDLADAIMLNAENQGRPAPSIAQRLQLARLIDEHESAGSPPAATASPALPAEVSPPSGDSTNRMKMTDTWSSNPDLLALVS